MNCWKPPFIFPEEKIRKASPGSCRLDTKSRLQRSHSAISWASIAEHLRWILENMAALIWHILHSSERNRRTSRRRGSDETWSQSQRTRTRSLTRAHPHTSKAAKKITSRRIVLKQWAKIDLFQLQRSADTSVNYNVLFTIKKHHEGTAIKGFCAIQSEIIPVRAPRAGRSQRARALGQPIAASRRPQTGGWCRLILRAVCTAGRTCGAEESERARRAVKRRRLRASTPLAHCCRCCDLQALWPLTSTVFPVLCLCFLCLISLNKGVKT